MPQTCADLERLVGALLDGDDRGRACGDGDVPALRRTRLRALRGRLPGEPGRRSTQSTGVTRARGAARARVAAVFALAAIAPLFFSAGGDVLDNMVLAAFYVMMALGLNIIVGYAGLIDLGLRGLLRDRRVHGRLLPGSGFWANAGSDGRGIAILAGDSVAGTPGIPSTSCSSSCSPSRRRPSPAP